MRDGELTHADYERLAEFRYLCAGFSSSARKPHRDEIERIAALLRELLTHF